MPARDPSPPARHELPEIDAAAFEAARAVDRLLAEARRLADAGAPGDGRSSAAQRTSPVDPRAAAADRWAGYFQRLPDQLRDAPLPDLRSAARRARSAFGPKDSIRDTFEPEVTEPVREAIDRLMRAIARYEAHAG